MTTEVGDEILTLTSGNPFLNVQLSKISLTVRSAGKRSSSFAATWRFLNKSSCSATWPPLQCRLPFTISFECIVFSLMHAMQKYSLHVFQVILQSLLESSFCEEVFSHSDYTASFVVCDCSKDHTNFWRSQCIVF